MEVGTGTLILSGPRVAVYSCEITVRSVNCTKYRPVSVTILYAKSTFLVTGEAKPGKSEQLSVYSNKH